MTGRSYWHVLAAGKCSELFLGSKEMKKAEKIEIARRMIAEGKNETTIEISGREMWLVIDPKYEEFDTFQTLNVDGVKVALGLKK